MRRPRWTLWQWFWRVRLALTIVLWELWVTRRWPLTMGWGPAWETACWVWDHFEVGGSVAQLRLQRIIEGAERYDA